MAIKIGKDPLKQQLPDVPSNTESSKNKGLGNTGNSDPVIKSRKTKKVDSESPKNPDFVVKSGDKEKFVSSKLFPVLDIKSKGGGFNSKGDYITPKSQLVNAITKQGDPNDNRTFDEIGAELDAANMFDDELTVEQKKAQVLQEPISVESQIPFEEQYLNVGDLENEYTQTVNGMMEGDPDAYANFQSLDSYIKQKPIKYGEAAIERLGLEEYYPDINTPLQVGSYQGSIVGSNPIFVAGGGYFPFSILDARKRAMEIAAANRVKEGEKIKELMLIDSAEQYQNQMSEIGLGMFNEFGESVGWDYRRLKDLSDPAGRAFAKKYNQYRDLAKRSLAIQKQYESVIEEWNTKDKYIPPHIWDTMSAWQSGMFNMEEMLNNPDFVNNVEREMQSYDNMIKDANEIKTKIDYNKDIAIDPTKTYTEEELNKYKEEIALIRDTSNYDILRTMKFSFVPMDRINAIVDEAVDNGHYYNPEQTKNDFSRYLTNLLADQIEANYIEAADRSTRVSVNVNNVPPDVSEVKNWSNISNTPEFKTTMDGLLTMGADKDTIDSQFSTMIGATPIKDTPFIDAIVPLGDEAGKLSYVSTNELEVYYGKTGQWMSFGSWTNARLKDEYGLTDTQINMYNQKVNDSSVTQESLNSTLVSWGIPKNDALIFSKNGGGSTLNCELTSRDLTYGYTDDGGSFIPYTHESTPEATSKTMVFDNFNVVDESGEETQIFSGLKVRKSNDITLTTPASHLESTLSSGSAGMKRMAKHGDAIAGNVANFNEPPVNNAPGRKAKTMF